jgi:hypothetical protein
MLTRLSNWWIARQQNAKRSLERVVLRARWRWVEHECWKAANTLTWLGFENGEAQQHIDAAKDAIYQAVLVAKEEAEAAVAGTQNQN